jgi:hypothetical protein
MGYIREPEGIDFVVEPHEYTEEDRRITIAAVAASKEKQRAEKRKAEKKRTKSVLM